MVKIECTYNDTTYATGMDIITHAAASGSHPALPTEKAWTKRCAHPRTPLMRDLLNEVIPRLYRWVIYL